MNLDVLSAIVVYLSKEDIIPISFTCKKWKDVCEAYESKNHKIIREAAVNGYVDIIKWARQNDFPGIFGLVNVQLNMDI